MTATRNTWTSTHSRAFQDVLKLVPQSIANDITCFAFYDHHPQCATGLDVTICTKQGEVIEFYQKQRLGSIKLHPVTSMSMKPVTVPTEMSINRNYKARIYYLILFSDVLYYLLRNDDSTFTLKHVNNVRRYVVEDFQCKVYSTEDAIPQIVNNIFEGISHPLDNYSEDDALSLHQSMKTQLKCLKYHLSDNERKIKETKKLRQQAAFQMYQKMHYPLRRAVFDKGDAKAIAGDICIRAESPWIKRCNQKLIVVIKICTENHQNLEDVKVLIHVSNTETLNYLTKLFKEIKEEPYWKEIKTHNITKSIETSIVVLIDLKELQLYKNNRIEFAAVVTYKMGNKDKILPQEEVKIPFLDVINEKFDVLSSNELDNRDVLAVIATSIETGLLFNCVSENDETNLSSLLCRHLNLTKVTNSRRLLIHKTAPYHTLNGIMLFIQEHNIEDDVIRLIKYNVTVFSRNNSQILSLIHYLNDAVPQRIAIIYPEHRMFPLNTEPKKEIKKPPAKTNVLGLAKSLLNQMQVIREHYDNCMLKMNQSADGNVIQKLGSKIDVYACGVQACSELRRKLNEAMFQGISNLTVENAGGISKEWNIQDSEDFLMAVDSD